MSRQSIIVNIIGFQIGWFACVLSAADDRPLIGVIVASIIIAIHIFLVNNKKKVIFLLLLVTLLGSTWDSLLTSQNLLIFNTGIIASFLAPYWIIIMWTLFATTLNISMRWLYGHYFYAMILGAITGPIVYQGGAALGAVNIPETLLANIMLALGWSVILPIVILLAEIFDNHAMHKVNTQ